MDNLIDSAKKFMKQLGGGGKGPVNPLYISGGFAAVGLYVIMKGLYKVEPGFQAIKFNCITGLNNKTYKEGYHVRLPFFETPVIYDCRMKNHLNQCICGTKDLQIVTLKIRLICRPNIYKLPQLYRMLGTNYEERTLMSIIYEICGSEVSKFHASQLITQRDSISMLLKHKITEKAKEFNLDVDDCALIDIHFSPVFSDAIEKKQVAQQDALKMKFKVDEALQEKKSTIIKAEGEQQSIINFGKANQKSNAFLLLKRLETSRVLSKTLKYSNNKIMLDSNSYFLNMPMSNDISKKV